MAKFAKGFTDGITSLTNKLANRRNVQTSNRMSSARVDWDELRAIYRSGMGSKIIRLKSGIALNDTLQFESEGDKDYYESRLQAHVKDCSKYMLAFGRSLIVMHERGADLSQPMPADIDWTTTNYHVFSGDMVYIQSVNLDLSSVNYFKPVMFSIRGSSIHPSRVVDFKYVKPVEFDAPQYFYGGISEFELIRNELVSDQVVQRAVPAILEKSSTLFYKVDGFKELLADNQEDTLIEYFTQMENLRSVYGAGIVDKEDEIETVTQALSNLAESDMITLRRLAMVTGLPLSWLVGEAASGLNSTGEGERQVLMQTIETFQSDYLLEPINRLMRMHGRGKVSFKDNQGEKPNERMEYETKAIANAQILWSMGEDYLKYLHDNAVITPDAYEGFFPAVESDDAYQGLPRLAEVSGGADQESEKDDTKGDAKSSLNGAQVTAILEIISRIRKGEITRNTAQKIIATAFPVSLEEAAALIDDVQEDVIDSDETKS